MLDTGVGSAGKHLGAGVVWIDQVLEVLAVVHAGDVGLEGADEFVLAVDVDRQFVAKVALAVLLGPTRFSVFLPALGRVPVCWGDLLLNDLFSACVMCCLGEGTKVASTICPPRAKTLGATIEPSRH